MATTKQMLEAILRYGHTGKIPKQELSAMEDMWDAVHRYGGLSNKQRAWVETVYFKHKLDKPETLPSAQKTVSKNVGFIEDVRFQTPIRIGTLAEFEKLCPHIEKGSTLWKRVASFLKDAGHVVELRPPLPKSPPKKAG